MTVILAPRFGSVTAITKRSRVQKIEIAVDGDPTIYRQKQGKDTKIPLGQYEAGYLEKMGYDTAISNNDPQAIKDLNNIDKTSLRALFNPNYDSSKSDALETIFYRNFWNGLSGIKKQDRIEHNGKQYGVVKAKEHFSIEPKNAKPVRDLISIIANNFGFMDSQGAAEINTEEKTLTFEHTKDSAKGARKIGGWSWF